MEPLVIKGLDELIDNFDNYVKYNARGTRDAMNKALSSASTESRHKAKAKWKGMLLRDFKKHTTPKKATVNNLTAGITIESKPIPLIQFAGDWKPSWSGASYKLKGRKRKLPHSFIRKGKYGEQIFKRSDRFAGKIIPRYAITPTSMFVAEDVKGDEVFITVFMEKFGHDYANQLKRFNITN